MRCTSYMTSKHPLYILSTIAFGVLIVLIVAWKYQQKEAKPAKIDRVTTGTIMLRGKIESAADIIGITGEMNGQLILETSKPGALYTVDTLLNKLKPYKFDFPNNTKAKSRFQYLISEGKLLLLCGNEPAAYEVKDSTVNKLDFLQTFNRAVKVTPRTYIVRGFLQGKGNYPVYYTYDHISHRIGKTIDPGKHSNKDFGLNEDGKMFYDSATGKIIYVYFYKSKVLSFDTSLSNVTQEKTVDNTYDDDFEISSLKIDDEKRKYTNSSPKKVKNYTSCIYDSTVYIRSLIKSNEPQQRENDIIDLYDIRNLKYRGSIYINKESNNKMKDFWIIKNRIFIVHENGISFYEIHFNNV